MIATRYTATAANGRWFALTGTALTLDDMARRAAERRRSEARDGIATPDEFGVSLGGRPVATLRARPDGRFDVVAGEGVAS